MQKGELEAKTGSVANNKIEDIEEGLLVTGGPGR